MRALYNMDNLRNIYKRALYNMHNMHNMHFPDAHFALQDMHYNSQMFSRSTFFHYLEYMEIVQVLILSYSYRRAM